MERPIGVVLGIVLTVVGMIAAGAIMWTQFSTAQGQIENVNPYAGITNSTCVHRGWGNLDSYERCRLAV